LSALLDHTLFSHASPEVLWKALAGALLIGMAKAGLNGCGLVAVVLFADIFDPKASTGIVLPLLIAADMMAYMLLRGGGSWKQMWKLAVPAMIGVVTGAWLLDKLDAHLAGKVIGWIIIALLALKLALDRWHEELKAFHRHHSFTWFMGTLAGVVTMLANAAGPVMTIYLLAQKSEKKEFLGIFARYFLFMNLFKLPFSAGIGLVTPTTLMTNLVLVPVVALGVWSGWQIIKRMPQRIFEWVMFLLALISAVNLVR
jgi:uncharacterized membrane protein YfcA